MTDVTLTTVQSLMILVGIFIIVSGVLLFSITTYKKPLKEIPLLNAKIKRFFGIFGAEIEGEWKGKQAKITWCPVCDGGILTISLHTKIFFNMSICKKGTPLAKIFAKEFGTKEIEIGDVQFDQKYRIQTQNQEQAINYLQDPKRRESINDLFEKKGFTYLKVTDSYIQVNQKPCYQRKDLSKGRIIGALEDLIQLV